MSPPAPAPSGTPKKPGVGVPPTSVPPTAASAGGPRDWDKPPKNPNGVCFDYVAEKIGGPKPKAREFVTETEFTNYLEDGKKAGRYREVPDKDINSFMNKTNLPEKTVVQLPGHVAIVGADGKLHHYLQLKEQNLTSATIQKLTEMERPDLDGFGNPILNEKGEPKLRQPHIGQKVRIWIPTGKP